MRWFLKPIVFGLTLYSLMLAGCSMPSATDHPDYILTAKNKRSESTTTGNLVADAIRRVHGLDFVFYPVDLLDESKVAYLKENLSEQEKSDIVDLYPQGASDVFLIGTMSGEDIKAFLVKRSRVRYQKDLDVAGLKYDIAFNGGFLSRANAVRTPDYPINDDDIYKVAISDFFFFSGYSFPGYKYGEGLNFSFNQVNKGVSARAAVEEFIGSPDKYEWPFLSEIRANVSFGSVEKKNLQLRPFEIQGARHVSPYLLHEVTTWGVVTAVGINEWYPGGVDIYIQDAIGDGNPQTSDAIHVYLQDESADIQVGDTLEVTGTVFEQILTGNPTRDKGLGRTSLRNVSEFQVFRPKTIDLPKPVEIGVGGRPIPSDAISTYNGNLNQKTYLNLTDGVDFWESLEGMRIAVKDIRVVGFRGGNENHETLDGEAKGYLNIYFVPDGLSAVKNESTGGGVFADVMKDNFNPQIMLIATNHLTKGFNTNWIFNVGDKIPGRIEGVLGFEKNIFGDGEYSLVVPDVLQQPAFENFKGSEEVKPIEHRNNNGENGEIASELVTSPDHLTIATYNVDNLAGYEDARIAEVSKMIAVNLRCPDIVSLVEIQDANGSDFDGTADGTVTLNKIIAALPTVKDTQDPCYQRQYKYINIDPLMHGEGGKPGGNIRISILYNPEKIDFQERPVPDIRIEALITPSGSLNYNPGRVYPNANAFKGSRKSIVAEFSVRGRKLFIIGNHFNSKLGDTSLWSAQQPPVFGSEKRRINMAGLVNQFVQRIEQGSPGAMVVVVGDFNAFAEEGAIINLKGEELWNLSEEFLPVNDRYTTNHNGNSQSLDYIFVNKALLNRYDGVEVIHMNSDFMGRLSDHDPVLSRFRLVD